MKKTALYDIHKKYGGKLVEFAGYELPIQFEGIIKEHNRVRENVGIFDVSHMGEFLVTGNDAEKFCDYLVTNDVKGLVDGQICYTPMCLENGGIVDDLLVYKYNKDKLLLVVNAANIEKDFNHVKSVAKNFNVNIENISGMISQMAIQGPKAQKVLEKMFNDVEFNSIKYYNFIEKDYNSENIIISRTGYTGEDGFEIYCPNDLAIELFELAMSAGKDYDIAPIGLGARDTLRLEAKLMLYGNDIDENTDPLMAKLKWTVKFEKDDFLGKKALLEIKEKKTEYNLVGFEMVDKGIARHGYEIYKDENSKIGYVTSGTSSPTLKKSIGLAYVKRGNGKVNTELFVKIRDKFKKIVIVKTPFYKGSVNPKL